MRVLLFGATGMVGQGVLRECLLASDVQEVVAVGRTALTQEHGKLHQVLHADMFDFQPLEHLLQGFDACFFCLGVSSVGMDEAKYTHLSYDLTLVAASTLARLNPQMTFIYVSGAGTDSSETGKTMWARIKGKTENALLRLPFKAVYLFRPGVIQPLHGVRSKTPLYQSIYTVVGPLLSLLRHVRPAWVVSTETVGRAMLSAVRHGAPLPVVEQADINRLATERAQMLHKSLVRRLDLITLQLFVAVHEEGTLTRAAAREAIAVSAASKRLMELEQVLGVSLFVRQAKGMQLTAAGETLLHHARQMLFNVEKMGLELGEHSHGVRGYVRMLANLSAIIQFLPEDLRDFSALHPQVKADLEERPSNGVVQGVIDGVADLGICSSDTDTKGLPGVTYRRDKLVVLMPADYPLASRKTLTFAETLDSDYVGLHSASSINMRTHAAAREAGKVLRLRIHVPGFDAMCRMVQANMGIGILPQKAYELFGRALGLHAVPLTDAWSDRSLILVVRDEAQLSPVSRLLFDYLRREQA